MADFTIQISNVDAALDADAAVFVVENENLKRAALDPPLEPLPMSTGAELKSSYKSILEETVARAHSSYQIQAAENKSKTANISELWKRTPNAIRDQVKSLLEANQIPTEA